MRLKLAAAFVAFAAVAFAQGDRGTITGTITDKTGAVVPNASIEITNQQTQFKSTVGSSTTGNYTFANVPVGTYDLAVTAMGFKKFVRPGVLVNVGETYRVDATLDVGATSDTVTVTAEAPLLKTESGEVSHQVDYTEADNLPLFTTNGGGGATGTGNVRDPLSVLNLLPGAQQSSDSVLRVNGLPSSSQTIMVEGMDATNGLWKQINQSVQQGVDAIQEVSVQTSNFAAEYGGAGGGYLNFTMRSGTNQYHGTAYDYFVNEALNSGLPFSAKCNVAPQGNICATDPNSGHIKNPVRRNDYGFTLGGPVRIPKLYNGKDKTFFFFNFEQFRQSTYTTNGVQTFPTAAYLAGNFATAPAAFVSGANFGSPVCPPSSPCIPGQVFDPQTRTTNAQGQLVETPFPGNLVPLSRQDPVARYLQSLFPAPNVANALTNNYNIPPYTNFEHTTIPSIKLDQSLNSKMKLSGYFSATITNNPNHNGLPQSISPVVPNADRSYTYRINFDDTVTPTLLFHVGVGLLYYHHPLAPSVSDFTTKAQAAAANGFDGAPGGKTYTPFAAGNLIPNFAGLSATFNGGTSLGGFFGPSLGSNSLGSAYTDNDVKPTGNTSLTWVRGNHTYKAGYSLVLEGFPQKSSLRAFGLLGFSAAQTQNPIEFNQPGITFGSGFPYASFLLGLTNSEQTSGINDTRLGNHSMSWFIQDSWKVNRKLTLELGLRWDYATLLSEEHGLLSDACFQCTNPQLNIPGAITYGATNGGPLFQNYKYSYGPHIGVAYQLNPKTVFRAGGSIAYSSAPDNAFLSPSVANFYTFGSPGLFLPVSQLSSGDTLTAYDRVYPRFDQYPFQTSSVGCGPAPSFSQPCVTPTEPFVTIARNAGRLPRIFQWSIGIQHELVRNLLVEAAYVGNRGAWFTAPLLDPNGINGLNYGRLGNLLTEGPGGKPLYGATQNLNVLDPSPLGPAGSPCAGISAYQLLTKNLTNPCVTTIFPALANPNSVYQGFPAVSSLTQALRPRPQWTGIPNFLGPPMGDTWYDSLQVKVTKRFSHGLSAQGNYTWSKSLDNAVNSNTSYLTPSDPILNDPYQGPHQKQFSGFDRPQAMTISFSYTTPKINSFGGDSFGGKALRYVARDWTVSGVLRYQSGILIGSATSNNALWTNFGYVNGVTNFGGTAPLENYVSGTSCLNVDPNSHYNPETTIGLNANHWSNQTNPSFGNAAPYYTNCRWQRQPAESLSVGRIFRVKEKYQLLVQAQFFNVFNRTFIPTPGVGTSTTPATCSNAFPGYPVPTPGGTCAAQGAIPGALFSGFGYSNTLNGAGTNPRSGQLVARFTF